MAATLGSGPARIGEVTALSPDFISPDELAALIRNGAPITLLDARFTLGEGSLLNEYLSGHIPGAMFVDLETELSGPRRPEIGSYPVPDADAFERAARSWGLDYDSEVIAYSGYTGISAGRLAWLLRWFGHERVRILDGGLQAWERRGYPLGSNRNWANKIGCFDAEEAGVPIVDAEGAVEFGRNGQLIDVRARSQYHLTKPDQGRHNRPPGRIPGAVNIPSTSLHHRNGALHPAEKIAGLLAAQGVDCDRPVAVYCGGGVASAWAAVALRGAGIDAALFTASWSEYITNPALPVEIDL